jgi:hypothetical protein
MFSFPKIQINFVRMCKIDKKEKIRKGFLYGSGGGLIKLHSNLLFLLLARHSLQAYSILSHISPSFAKGGVGEECKYGRG